MLMDDITNTFKELISLFDPDLSGGCPPIKIKNTPTTTTSHIINVISKNQIKNCGPSRARTYDLLIHICVIYHNSVDYIITLDFNVRVSDA